MTEIILHKYNLFINASFRLLKKKGRKKSVDRLAAIDADFYNMFQGTNIFIYSPQLKMKNKWLSPININSYVVFVSFQFFCAY